MPIESAIFRVNEADFCGFFIKFKEIGDISERAFSGIGKNCCVYKLLIHKHFLCYFESLYSDHQFFDCVFRLKPTSVGFFLG